MTLDLSKTLFMHVFDIGQFRFIEAVDENTSKFRKVDHFPGPPSIRKDAGIFIYRNSEMRPTNPVYIV